jgi:hypothetical protein
VSDIGATIRHRNLAGRHPKLEAARMAVLAVTVLLGVVLLDAHDFVNRRTRRR